MELKSGNMEDLVGDHVFARDPRLIVTFLHQMLQALDYLASESVIHRDVKPEKVLYTPAAATCTSSQTLA